MNFQKCISATSVDGKHFVIATKRALPGEIMFEEEASLFVTKETYSQETFADLQAESKISDYFWALFGAFTALSSEKKWEILNLYSPTEGPLCQGLRLKLLSMECPPTDVEIFVKFISAFSHHGYRSEGDSSCCMFSEKMSKLSFSCIPNCVIRLADRRATVRAILSIAEGDPLTVWCDEREVFQSIPLRKAILMSRKGIVCKCSRCEAPGDDTRQFDCTNEQCSGRHYAGQSSLDDTAYLLPCSVCSGIAPKDHEERMLQLEKDLPTISKTLWKELGQKPIESHKLAIHQKVLSIRFPKYHHLSNSLHKLLCVTAGAADQFQYIQAFARSTDAQPAFPNCGTDADLFHIGRMYFVCATEESLCLAKYYLQRAVCMRLVLDGREQRVPQYDAQLLEALWYYPNPCKTVTECMFCGESPSSAALTLTRCSKCSEVAYCSAGCQRAHYALHCHLCVGDKK